MACSLPCRVFDAHNSSNGSQCGRSRGPPMRHESARIMVGFGAVGVRTIERILRLHSVYNEQHWSLAEGEICD